jgi:hypothetical protein
MEPDECSKPKTVHSMVNNASPETSKSGSLMLACKGSVIWNAGYAKLTGSVTHIATHSILPTPLSPVHRSIPHQIPNLIVGYSISIMPATTKCPKLRKTEQRPRELSVNRLTSFVSMWNQWLWCKHSAACSLIETEWQGQSSCIWWIVSTITSPFKMICQSLESAVQWWRPLPSLREEWQCHGNCLTRKPSAASNVGCLSNLAVIQKWQQLKWMLSSSWLL